MAAKEEEKKKAGEEQAKEEERQKKATSEGKLVRTGAVCKNGKVDRRQRHKSVSGPRAQEAAAGSALLVAGGRPERRQPQVRRGWKERDGRAHCAPLPQPPPPGSGLQLKSLGVRAPSPAAASRGEREQPGSGRRPPAQGNRGSQGVVFGSEEVPAQPSKFCPKADKRIAPR